jgi:ATP-dependent DNA ligase
VAALVRSSRAVFVAFDLLALGERDLRAAPFVERRGLLSSLVGGPAAVRLTPATLDRSEASAWLAGAGEGFDGVVAKHSSLVYSAGKRAMVKVKPLTSVDCVVAGVRVASGTTRVVSLLLGLYDRGSVLRHVGVASSFAHEQGRSLWDDVAPYVVPLAGHPWEHGFGIEPRPMGRLRGAAGVWTPDLVQDWVPLAPELVCEVMFDQLDADRFRHPARFARWRFDRTPGSCGFDQLVRR